jgi:methionine synthase I (cobalamin-dependent)/5,10-methylenetetrahydrofolate reductase
MTDSPVKPLLERLAQGVIVADGAMGTMLYSRGVFVNRCFDELNLSSPGLVRTIHAEYVEAGAELLETNTFGAQRLKLAAHGLEGQVAKINREGARLAREAAAGRALVAGAMGPIGKALQPLGNVAYAEAVDAYREQAQGLADGGVDAFILETMPSLDQAQAALEAVRAVSALPTIVLLTFNEEGTALYGEPPEVVVERLEALGVDVIGANCSQGPASMLDTVKRMAAVAKRARLAAMPNAGAPALVEGRYVYLCTPEYMASHARRMIAAGVSLVGGCCGTTPAHIKNLVRSVRMLQPSREAAVALERPVRAAEAPKPLPREEKSPLARKLARGQFVVSVELDPPRGADPGAIMDRAQYCRENEVDAINVADGPRASARMSAQSLCVLLQNKVGVDTILHYTCRDRNLLGIQSDLLGAYAMGLRNILAITGDPPKLGDYPDATAVYDVDSIGLIRIMDHLNHGCDLAGNLIGPPLGLHIGCGADPSKPDMEKEIQRLESKVKAGAEYIMTQPIYDPAHLERFLSAVKHLHTPILVGLLPLYSHRNAEFLHNEVPGMRIPDDIRERMRKAGSGDEAKLEGVKIAQEALLVAREQAQGAYIMPPFNKVELAVRVIEVLE